MKIFWIILLVVQLLHLTTVAFADRPFGWVQFGQLMLDLFFIGVSLYWIEVHHRRRP